VHCDQIGSRHEARAADSSVGRFLRRVANDEAVTLHDVALHARVPFARIEACRQGSKRLSPEDQMRVATAVATIAPMHAGLAFALYGQAQAELRFNAREVRSHSSYPGPEAARGDLY
jgi:hypothetical protein